MAKNKFRITEKDFLLAKRKLLERGGDCKVRKASAVPYNQTEIKEGL